MFRKGIMALTRPKALNRLLQIKRVHRLTVIGQVECAPPWLVAEEAFECSRIWLTCVLEDAADRACSIRVAV